MGSNASTGLDLKMVETEPKQERPTEHLEETNRKSHQLLPVFPPPHTSSVAYTLLNLGAEFRQHGEGLSASWGCTPEN